MRKIVLLQSSKTTAQIFTKEQLLYLEKFGEVIINQDEEGVQATTVKNLLKDADIAVTSWGCPMLDQNILESAPKLKAVLHAAGTVKGIVSPELWERGIRVSSAADALGKGVAETALGLMIMSLKNVWKLTKNTREGEWNKDKDKIKEVFGITVGVVGAGRAGRHFIRLLQAFDVNIVVFDPTVSEDEAKTIGVTKLELEDLLTQSDVVSIHAPSIPETENMFNKRRLQLIKDDAILINTARGSIIDEAALISELEKGRLLVCLDVTNPEPPAVDHPFRSLPNVVLTPHIAGAVNNGLQRLGQYVVEDIERFLAGNKMAGEVEYAELNQLA
ncbi:hydroxyacid dehydrogenase [Bacillus niameyensis]|uniref:hydroxyacid dehydrogenase n=1 Tax=Bacillus niameyensis TaxID=1522308 RepID=UPI000782D61F|nr:hydroxyacid dehydrogenase [Bacillus niameyensis]